MKKITLLMLSLFSFIIASADKRGDTFEKDGFVYTILTEYVIKSPFNDWLVYTENNINNERNSYLLEASQGRIDTADIELLLKDTILRNEGLVYVSGRTKLDSIVKIPGYLYYQTSYCRSEKTMAKYQVVGIGEKVFEGAKLKDIVLPSGLTFIGKEAFKNMELTNGVLFMPPVGKIKENAFDGMKARLFLKGNCSFENTFKNIDSLPEIYTSHSQKGDRSSGLDPKLVYTIGDDIYEEWVNNSEFNYRIEHIPYIDSKNPPRFNTYRQLDSKSKESVPKVTVQTVNKYEKTGTDMDMVLPREYAVWNPYTRNTVRYKEFIMNKTIYRCLKGNDYLYFTIDGKPITDIESLVDDNGQDPFGRQVISEDEMKAKRAAREREKKLNEKMNSLKNIFMNF